MTLTVGQEVFACGKALIGGGLEIRRYFVLEVTLSRIVLGDSKKPSSHRTDIYIERFDKTLYATSKVEAVNKYVTGTIKNNRLEIAALKKEIKELEDENHKLIKIDWTKLKVQQYPEDWTPCDL